MGGKIHESESESKSAYTIIHESESESKPSCARIHESKSESRQSVRESESSHESQKSALEYSISGLNYWGKAANHQHKWILITNLILIQWLLKNVSLNKLLDNKPTLFSQCHASSSIDENSDNSKVENMIFTDPWRSI